MSREWWSDDDKPLVFRTHDGYWFARGRAAEVPCGRLMLIFLRWRDAIAWALDPYWPDATYWDEV